MQVSKPTNKKSLRHKIYFALFIVFAGLVIAACVSTITILSQDASVNPGDTAHMVINLQWAATNYDRTDRQVVGICVPKSWNAAQNTTMTYKSDVGDGNMVLIPDGIVDPATKLSYAAAFAKKFGIGPNYINDMEWVAFWSDVKLSVANQSTVNGQIYINIKTGTDNLSFKPGYAMCEDEDGLSDANSGYYTSLFGDCMLVATPTADDIQDFCNPQIGTNDPASATDNDIVTVTYNGSLDTTTLKNASDIYFCAKAFTTDGGVIDMCQQTDQTKLTPSGLQQWRIDFGLKSYLTCKAGKASPGSNIISLIKKVLSKPDMVIRLIHSNTFLNVNSKAYNPLFY